MLHFQSFYIFVAEKQTNATDYGIKQKTMPMGWEKYKDIYVEASALILVSEISPKSKKHARVKARMLTSVGVGFYSDIAFWVFGDTSET